MTPGLNEAVVDRVDALGTTAWSGTCYRYAAARREPLSGEGARRFGGRWNPPDLFPTVYLAQPLRSCMREFQRYASAQNTEPEHLLQVPYRLHTIAVEGLQVLDLRTPNARTYVGLADEDLVDDDWSACQSIGHAAWFLNMAGVIAPSATGVGLVAAAFEFRAEVGQVRVARSEDFTPELFRDASAT